MFFFLPIPAHDEETAHKIADQHHRDTLTRQRLSYEQKRHAAINAMTKEEQEEYDIAMVTLKKSFLAITHTNTGDGAEGRIQALAIRALKNMLPSEVLALYRKEDLPTYNKMVILANKQLLRDQKAAEEQDPKYFTSGFDSQDFMATLNAKRAAREKLQNFSERRAYVSAYQKVEEEIHALVTPPYNNKYYNLDKLQRMKDGLDCIPPEMLLKWTKKHMPDDIALTCDVATLGLQADFADKLAKQPIKTTTAVALAGAAATTYAKAHTPKGQYASFGLAAVAGLLAFASLIKHMRLKAFAKRTRKNQTIQIDLYNLHPLVRDLAKNPLPAATTLTEEFKNGWRETRKDFRTVLSIARNKQQATYQK
ncbi:MAG: hypothetical protein II942_04780 [Alphaproteobacteria bacterium]|nr:hypothetical protein [Alphaproteobacteria bacterium]